jgi:hypothetical protein
MKVNYERLVELNKEALTADSGQMSCFYLIQQGVERYLQPHEELSDQWLAFLVEVGVLEYQEEKKKIVEPFNFMGNDRTESN